MIFPLAIPNKSAKTVITQILGRGCSSGVERNLAKVEVEGSKPFTRSNFFSYHF